MRRILSLLLVLLAFSGLAFAIQRIPPPPAPQQQAGGVFISDTVSTTTQTKLSNTYHDANLNYQLALPQEWIVDTSHKKAPVDLFETPAKDAFIAIQVFDDARSNSEEGGAAIMEDIRNGFDGSGFVIKRIEERTWKKQYPALFALSANTNLKGERWQSKQYTIVFGGKKNTVVNLTASAQAQVFSSQETLLDAVLNSFEIKVY